MTLVLILVISALAIFACGGDGSVGQDPGDVVEPLTTLTPAESALWDRASASFQAADGGLWNTMYDYLSPRARETCDLLGYSGRIGVYAELIRGFMEIGDGTQLLFRVRDVEVQGAEGTVYLDLFSEGQRVDYGEIPKQRWAQLDGEWWEEHPDWSDGCVGWKAFE